jgi:hypothetical protein
VNKTIETKLCIRIERPNKLVQVVKKENCKAIEITSIEPEKMYTGKEKEINNYIEEMCKDREELNVVIMPNKKIFFKR